MSKNRFATRAAVAAGFFCLCAVPGLTCAQSAPPPGGMSHMSAGGSKKNATPMDDFAGLTFTEEQKAKIEQIHQSTKRKLDTVDKDEKLAPETKSAMVQGYQRLEATEIFDVLTPEQQKEVRKNVLARRAAEKQGAQQKNQKKLVPAPTVNSGPPPASARQ